MCNIGEGVYKRGMQEGMSKMLDMMRLAGMSEDEINNVLAQGKKLQSIQRNN